MIACLLGLSAFSAHAAVTSPSSETAFTESTATITSQASTTRKPAATPTPIPAGNVRRAAVRPGTRAPLPNRARPYPASPGGAVNSRPATNANGTAAAPSANLLPSARKIPSGANVSVPDMRAPGMGDPSAHLGNSLSTAPIIAAPAAVSDSSGKEETVDFADDVANSFNPYLFTRDPLWALLPLGMLILLGLHLLPVPKRKRKRKIQTEDFLKDLRGPAPAALAAANAGGTRSGAAAVTGVAVDPAGTQFTRTATRTETHTVTGFGTNTGESRALATARAAENANAKTKHKSNEKTAAASGRKPSSSSEGSNG